jgi:acetyl-CoA carboxylase beta subunit
MRKKNKDICQHCAFHLPMESFDRIESLIDSGTWSPTDENMVSIDMRFLDPHRRF